MFPEIKNTILCKQGNMSKVTAGTYENLGYVVLKIMTPRLMGDERFLYRWWQEIFIDSILSKVTSVPEVILAGNTPSPWFVQRYIKGISLREWIESQVYPLSKEVRLKAISILLDLIEIAEKAWEMKITHRDITPENIIISLEGKPFLIDWGLASIDINYRFGLYENKYNKSVPIPKEKICFNNRLTEVWRRHGRAGYAAPEQAEAFNNIPTMKNDIYSIAVIAVEVLIGLKLFDNGEDPLSIIEKQRDIKYLNRMNDNLKDIFGNQFYKFLLCDHNKRSTDIILLKHIIGGFK